MGPTNGASAKPANPIEAAIIRQGNAVEKLEHMAEALISRLGPAISSDTAKTTDEDQRSDSSGSSALACDIDGLRRRIESLHDRFGFLIDNLEI